MLSLGVSAMKIETDEVDEFTGKRTLITSWESISMKNMHIRFRLQNDTQFLDFKMFEDGAIVIGEGDKLMFKSTTDAIGEFSSVRIYHGTKGGGAVGFIGSAAWGIFATYTGDLNYFSDNITKLIRVYTTDSYYDKKVGDGDGKKLQKLYALFASALSGDATSGASYKNYIVTYYKSKDGGKTWETVDEKYLKDQSQEEIKQIMDEWQSKSADKIVYKCRVKKE